MTTTAPAAHPPAVAAPPRDLRTFWRVTLAVLLPLGPLLVTISRALMPYWTADDSATVVASSLADLDRLELLAWLGLPVLGLVLMSVLVLGYVARRGAPVLATLGAGLSFAAYAGLGSLGNIDFLVLVLGRAGVDPAAILQVVEASADHPIATVGGFGWVVGHIVGMILLGAALWQARVVPWWAGVALIACQPIHLVAAVILPSRALDVVAGWGLTTIGCAVVAVAMLRMRDDDWDLPPARRA